MTAAEIERFRRGLRRARRRQGAFERLVRVAIRLACRLFGWRIEVTGVALIPRDAGRCRGAGCIVAGAPHRAWIDPFLVMAAWPSDAARLAWFGDGAAMTRSWWRRRLFPRIGMIPIAPGAGGPRAYAELASEALAAGAAVALFTEKGPPSAPGETRTIAPGFAYLALRAGAPVVPVVLAGTHGIARGSSFTVDVLPPIAAGPAIADPFTPAHREPVRRLVETYGQAIATVLPGRTAFTDLRRPARERWRWLATLFR